MASNNLHFKTAIELMAGVGGVLVLFLSTVAIVWLRMNRSANLPEA